MLRGELQKPNCLVDVAGLLQVVGQQGGSLLDPLAGRRLGTWLPRRAAPFGRRGSVA